MTALLEVTGLSKRFGELRALDGIGLTVAQRGVHSIIGPNGAGKTTLFNCITGVVKPDEGRRHARGPRHHQARRGATGYGSGWCGRSRSAGCSTACPRGRTSGWRCRRPA